MKFQTVYGMHISTKFDGIDSKRWALRLICSSISLNDFHPQFVDVEHCSSRTVVPLVKMALFESGLGAILRLRVSIAIGILSTVMI